MPEEQIRPYQAKSIDQIRAHFQKGLRRVLLWLPTGAGKTFIFCRMIRDTQARGFKAIVLVRGRKLVDQASQRLFREHVDHGVLMNNHWNFRPHLPIQVASIDTLISRKLTPPADLIVIDEWHQAFSKGYKEFLSKYSSVFIVGVTATPWVSANARHLAQAIVHPVSMLELIEEGYLVPFRPFAPAEPDLTGVKISSSTKDYVVDQLEGAMVKGQLTGKIIEHWKKLAENKPTLCFAVNIHHSKLLTQRFLEAGIQAEHCDADSSDGERSAIQRRLETGETKVICNVGIFGTGVDIPSLGAIIMARPTQSRNLFVQQAGRGTRIFPGKSDCLLLDHAGNIGRHGLPTDEPEIDLSGKEKETHKKESKTCRFCFAVFRGKVCPECGVEPSAAVIVTPEESDDELKEILLEPDPTLRAYKDFQRIARNGGYKPAWAMYRLINSVGLEKAAPYLPKWFIQHYHTTKSPFLPVTDRSQ